MRAAWGGGVCKPPSLRGVVGGPRGAGGRGLLCLGSSLCLPWVGTKAGFIGVSQCMKGVVSMLLWFMFRDQEECRARWGPVPERNKKIGKT